MNCTEGGGGSNDVGSINYTNEENGISLLFFLVTNFPVILSVRLVNMTWIEYVYRLVLILVFVVFTWKIGYLRRMH